MESLKIPIQKEDGRLVSLAIALSHRNVVKIPLGIPSPDGAANPGMYFGSMKTLKYLVNKGILTPEQVAKLLAEDSLKDYTIRETPYG
jgi:hypothetical protein